MLKLQSIDPPLEVPDHPDELPETEGVRMLLVDWGDRDPDWGRSLTAWRAAVAQKRHGRRSCSPSRRGRGEAPNGSLVTQRLETGQA